MGQQIGRWLLVVLSLGAASDAVAQTPVLDAAKSKDVAAVRKLLKGGVKVDVAEVDGTTALHWAVLADDMEMSRLLPGAGARAGAANRYGITPLTLAASNGNLALVQTLLAAGADANAATPEGETVLMTAARTGRADVIQALLARGATVDAREQWLGEDALMWAASENHAAAVRALIAGGAALDAQSNVSSFPRRKTPLTVLPRGGWTPLMYAARQGAVDVVHVLVDAGANLDATDPDGSSALMLAIINAHYDLAAVLIENGADVNLTDATGTGPLFATIDMHTLPWVFGLPNPRADGSLDEIGLSKMLLTYGGNPNARLRTPALQRLHTPGDPALTDGATPFMRAARGADLTMMQLLLAAGADPSLKQKNGTSTLLIASGLGWRAGDANLNTRDHGTEQEAIEAIELCLTRGANILEANDNGDTVLHAAAGRGEAAAIVRYLVDHGARPDARNKRGQTPLDVALARKGQDGAMAVSVKTAGLLRELLAKTSSARVEQ